MLHLVDREAEKAVVAKVVVVKAVVVTVEAEKVVV